MQLTNGRQTSADQNVYAYISNCKTDPCGNIGYVIVTPLSKQAEEVNVFNPWNKRLKTNGTRRRSDSYFVIKKEKNSGK